MHQQTYDFDERGMCNQAYTSVEGCCWSKGAGVFINKFSDFLHVRYKKLGAHHCFLKMFISSASFLWAQSAFSLVSTLNSFQSVLMITAAASDLTLAGSHGKGHLLLLLSQDYLSTSKACNKRLAAILHGDKSQGTPDSPPPSSLFQVTSITLEELVHKSES